MALDKIREKVDNDYDEAVQRRNALDRRGSELAQEADIFAGQIVAGFEGERVLERKPEDKVTASFVDAKKDEIESRQDYSRSRKKSSGVRPEQEVSPAEEVTLH
jgi:hypothetical protein